MVSGFRSSKAGQPNLAPGHGDDKVGKQSGSDKDYRR